MGTDKAMLKILDVPIIEKIYKVMSEVFKETIVITNEPDRYKFLDCKMQRDIYPGRGPLSGIHSGLVFSMTEKNFFVACDMLFIKKEIFDFIINYKTDKPITIPCSGGKEHYLFGLYNKECVRIAEQILKSPVDSKGKSINYKMGRFVNMAGSEIINIEDQHFYEERLMFNLNDSDDYDKLRDMI